MISKQNFDHYVKMDAERRPIAIVCLGGGVLAGLFVSIIGLFLTSSFSLAVVIYLISSIAISFGLLTLWLVRYIAIPKIKEKFIRK